MRAMIIAVMLLSAAMTRLPVDAAAAEGADAGTPPAADTTPPAPQGEHLHPALMTLNAGKGGTISLGDSEPSKLLGGVEIGYEKIRIRCDHVDYWQSLLPGTKRAVLDRAYFINGPDAAEPEHVVFDSRKTELPTVGFRGLMTPVKVEVLRQPLDELQPKLARFRVLLHQLGDFAGELQSANGWAPYAGWADEAEMELVADVVEAGLIKPRFTTIVFIGRAAAAGETRRGARFERLEQPIPPGTAAKMLHTQAMNWWVESSRITVAFDATGRAKQIDTDHDTHGEGTPSLDMPVQPRRSQPTLEPRR
jgi:hypothetical protein